MKTLVVNLFGGACTGKSTLASELFKDLKIKGVDCEIVYEYARELIWEGNLEKLKDQQSVFAEQRWRIVRLLNKVEVIITDSPITNSIIYDVEKNPILRSLTLYEFNKFNSLNYYLERDRKSVV